IYEMFKIQTLNKISPKGLREFPHEKYEVASEFSNPDAILLRSFEMHGMNIPSSVKAIGRAGAGTNNIPIELMDKKGIPVFNTPGANANAVMEMVLCALLISSRPVIKAAEWTKSLKGKGDNIPELCEKGKSQFKGPELRGKTLGIIGLGAIGTKVANAASALKMNVIGYDPFISVDAAWGLSRRVHKAENLDSLLAQSEYITIHIPQTPDTKGLINANSIKTMKDQIRIINFARGGLVVNTDIIKALKSGKVASFITDFTDEELLHAENAICLPHLGASTPEAEDNCAMMAVKELRDFLETGAIQNSVNFPRCTIDTPIPQNGTRLCISNKNVPNMVSQITSLLAANNQNISGMINRNRNNLAYNIMDIDGEVTQETIEALQSIKAVINVRAIYESKPN
ncbi:MAG TPA: phosphoglycerate dehydrogenase, partial [Treponemataceae bacterium]|nr:phosphoglycerate dehydrogenase [Treponemataceae bacterium]